MGPTGQRKLIAMAEPKTNWRKTFRLALFIFWLAGILIPMAWFGRFSGAYQRAFNTIFGPQWMHILMHTILYAGLAFMLAQWLAAMTGRQALGRLAGIVLLVGLGQEAFQALSNQALLPGAAIFDLGVDLFGGFIGWELASLINSQSQPKR